MSKFYFFSQVLALIAAPYALSESSTVEVYSSGLRIHCNTKEIEIYAKARVPKHLEKALLDKVGNDSIVRGKFEVRVFTRKKMKQLNEFTANDHTDPLESSWPSIEHEQLTLFATARGKPNRLIYQGIDLTQQAMCRFQ